MRKFKVVKKFPGGPAVGEIMNNTEGNWFWHPSCCVSYAEHDLEGFVEEIKEPEFWYMTSYGDILSRSEAVNDGREVDFVPNWLRFPTKEHAHAFAYGLKDIEFWRRVERVLNRNELKEEFSELSGFVAALNSRRHD